VATVHANAAAAKAAEMEEEKQKHIRRVLSRTGPHTTASAL
jgi:hypothetical protein